MEILAHSACFVIITAILSGAACAQEVLATPVGKPTGKTQSATNEGSLADLSVSTQLGCGPFPFDDLRFSVYLVGKLMGFHARVRVTYTRARQYYKHVDTPKNDKSAITWLDAEDVFCTIVFQGPRREISDSWEHHFPESLGSYPGNHNIQVCTNPDPLFHRFLRAVHFPEGSMHLLSHSLSLWRSGDQPTALGAALESEDVVLGWIAVDKLKSEALGKVALEASNPRTRISAVERLVDPGVLRRVAAEDKDKTVRWWAKRTLKCLKRNQDCPTDARPDCCD